MREKVFVLKYYLMYSMEVVNSLIRHSIVSTIQGPDTSQKSSTEFTVLSPAVMEAVYCLFLFSVLTTKWGRVYKESIIISTFWKLEILSTSALMLHLFGKEKSMNIDDRMKGFKHHIFSKATMVKMALTHS